MCYNAAYLTKRKIRYAEHYGDNDADIDRLKRQLDELSTPIHYNVSGFLYPKLLVVTDDAPDSFQLLTWGLVPHFMQDINHPKQLRWNTLNCVGEKMYETKSFRQAALHQRCLIFFDGFFEPHIYNGRSYPFFIQHSDESPMIIAGLWDDNKSLKSISLVTVKASPLLSRIHNDKLRMPLMLQKAEAREWLLHDPEPNIDKQRIQYLMEYNDDSILSPHTTRPIRSNKKLSRTAPGDVPAAIAPYFYPEISKEYYASILYG